MSSMPYSAGPFEFEAAGGETTHVVLRVPARASIQTLRLSQLSGAEVNAVFELFQSIRACPPEGADSESVGLVGDADQYTVFGKKTRNSGAAFLEFDKHYGYANKDGTPTNQERKLYLAITPEGTGVKTWAFSMELQLPLPV